MSRLSVRVRGQPPLIRAGITANRSAERVACAGIFVIGEVADGIGTPTPRRLATQSVRPEIQQVLDAITMSPAWVRKARHDLLVANPLAYALYFPLLADPHRPAETARFAFLDPAA